MIERGGFIERFGGVFEHSAWIAERVFDSMPTPPLTATALHRAMCEVFRNAGREEKLAVLRAHPDLAGKLAVAGDLTEESKQEQAGAGLDRLSTDEHAEFTRLNTYYTRHFGFPFIIAVKGLDKHAVLDAFRSRIANTQEQEFSTACMQVEKIARLRLEALLD